MADSARTPGTVATTNQTVTATLQLKPHTNDNYTASIGIDNPYITSVTPSRYMTEYEIDLPGDPKLTTCNGSIRYSNTVRATRDELKVFLLTARSHLQTLLQDDRTRFQCVVTLKSDDIIEQTYYQINELGGATADALDADDYRYTELSDDVIKLSPVYHDSITLSQ